MAFHERQLLTISAGKPPFRFRPSFSRSALRPMSASYADPLIPGKQTLDSQITEGSGRDRGMARSSSSTSYLPLAGCLASCHAARPADRISVVALVGVQDVAVRKPFEQRLSSGAVCYLSASEHEGKRATLSVCQRGD